MRFDIVTDTFPPDVNGVAMTLSRLRAGLQERGHLVHVIRTGEICPNNGETQASSLGWPGYKEVRLGLPENFKLWDRWKRKRPDAIYIAIESMLGASAMETAKVMGIPVVTGFHTNFQEYVEQYYFKGLNAMATNYLKNFHNKADITLAPSQEVVDMLLDLGIKHARLMDRGVDTELYHPQKRSDELRAQWGVGKDDKVLITVGRVATEKNLTLAIRAYRAILKQSPNTKLVLVGDGPIREELEADNPDVIFAGMLVGEDLAVHYASSDILLFPSETETFGNVTLEGLANGLICVAYNYAATERFIVNGENGFSATKGDEEEFISKALEAARQSDNTAIKEKARKTAEAKGWGKVIDVFEGSLMGLSKQSPSKNFSRGLNKKPLSFRSVFLSDIHVGTKDAKIREVTDFIRSIYCENLYLNGDIFDTWAINRGSKWTLRDTRFLRVLLRKLEEEKVNITYIRGNHDEILSRFLPLNLDRLSIVKEITHTGINGKSYLVTHGDKFDSTALQDKILNQIGSACYGVLLYVNRLYNNYRSWRGQSYLSIAKDFKSRFHGATEFIEKYEQNLTKHAKEEGFDGIICGHLHTPACKEVNGIDYFNSGDWVESLSALVEHHDGTFETLTYKEFLEKISKTD